MSLKNVHVVFIVAAALLAVFCAVRAFGSFLTDPSLVAAVAGVGALAGAALLVRYEARFLRRCREQGLQ